jgi:Cyclin, N-terminal domain
MPPSLTLSKIRSLKQQALHAAVKANLEIGTVALACVYFERLCLDCRVDKSNRRLTSAACLLLASKINEPNQSLVIREEENDGDDDIMSTRLQSWVRPNKRSNKMFASLLLFFTQDWVSFFCIVLMYQCRPL